MTGLHKSLLHTWAHEHFYWTIDDWKHVSWSQESQFQFYWTDLRVLTSWIKEPTCPGGCFSEWSLCDGMERWACTVGVIWDHLYVDRWHSEVWPDVNILLDHLHPCLYMVYSNALNISSNTKGHPICQQLLSSGSRSTRMTIDSFNGRLNFQTWKLLSISGMPGNVMFRSNFLKICIPICRLSCRIHGVNCYHDFIQTLDRSMPHSVAKFLCAHGGKYTILGRCNIFVALECVHISWKFSLKFG